MENDSYFTIHTAVQLKSPSYWPRSSVRDRQLQLGIRALPNIQLYSGSQRYVPTLQAMSATPSLLQLG